MSSNNKGNNLAAQINVILIHGQPGCAEDFDDIQDRFPMSINSIAFDRPGWGRSDLQVASLDENARALIAFVDSLDAPELLLVGYSYGAAVTLRAACDFQGRFTGLVLIAPVGGLGSISTLDRLLSGAAKAFRKAAMLRLWSDRFQERFRSFLSFQFEQTILERDLTDLWRDIDRVEIPVELIVGEDDFLNPLGGTLALYDKLRHANLHLVKGAGHMLLDQAPEVIVSCVSHLVAKVSGPI